MPSRRKLPSSLLSSNIGRSPWQMRMSTAGWLSAAVEKVCDFLVGMVVLRSIIGVARLPIGLDGERQRRHVEQEHVLDVALEHAALDGGADGDHLVRVDALVRVFAGELLGGLDHLRHAGHAADQDEFVDLAGADAGLLEAVAHRLLGALEEADRSSAPAWSG